MDLVWVDDLLEGDIAGAQLFNEADHLTEGHVAIIVTLNQENGRAPLIESGVGRGGKGKLFGIFVVRSGGGSLLPLRKKV